MKHCVILVPGLGDRIFRHNWFTKKWKEDDIEVFIHPAPWNKKKEEFKPKLDRLLKHIDRLYAKGYKISLIGTSAGGSMVINAFSQRKSKIHKVINICGRMRDGNSKWLPLIIAAKNHPAFYESAIMCEKELSKLSQKDKEKIMTVTPQPFDGIVPLYCIPIKGATNIAIAVPFHILAIGAALSIFRKPLHQFILA